MFAKSKRSKPVIIFGVDSLSTHQWLTAGCAIDTVSIKRALCMYVPKGETDIRKSANTDAYMIGS